MATQNFILLKSSVTYMDNDSSIYISNGNHLLNNVKMKSGVAYTINKGDIIQDLDFKPLTSKDLQWEFN